MRGLLLLVLVCPTVAAQAVGVYDISWEDTGEGLVPVEGELPVHIDYEIACRFGAPKAVQEAQLELTARPGPYKLESGATQALATPLCTPGDMSRQGNFTINISAQSDAVGGARERLELDGVITWDENGQEQNNEAPELHIYRNMTYFGALNFTVAAPIELSENVYHYPIKVHNIGNAQSRVIFYTGVNPDGVRVGMPTQTVLGLEDPQNVETDVAYVTAKDADCGATLTAQLYAMAFHYFDDDLRGENVMREIAIESSSCLSLGRAGGIRIPLTLGLVGLLVGGAYYARKRLA